MPKSYTFVRSYKSSSTPGKFYDVKIDEEGTLSCNCPGWTKRVATDGSRSCKHVIDAGANLARYTGPRVTQRYEARKGRFVKQVNVFNLSNGSNTSGGPRPIQTTQVSEIISQREAMRQSITPPKLTATSSVTTRRTRQRQKPGQSTEEIQAEMSEASERGRRQVNPDFEEFDEMTTIERGKRRSL